MDILTITCYLIIAAFFASATELVMPGIIPGGFITAMIAGTTGGWIGNTLIGNFGPNFVGVALIPCVVGSAMIVLAVSLCSRRHAGSGAQLPLNRRLKTYLSEDQI